MQPEELTEDERVNKGGMYLRQKGLRCPRGSDASKKNLHVKGTLGNISQH